jgi:hemoglobin-like flavoprotein
MDLQRKKLHDAIGVLINFRARDYPNPMLRHATQHQELDLRPEYFDAFRDAFLTVLKQLELEVNEHAIDAWRAIFDTGIAYMTTARRKI